MKTTKKTTVYQIYESENNGNWYIRKSKKSRIDLLKSKKRTINILDAVQGEKNAELTILKLLINHPNIHRFGRKYISVYSIIEYFRGQKGWKCLDALSRLYCRPIRVSVSLDESYRNNSLSTFNPGTGYTRWQNIQGLQILTEWKAQGLPWPGIVDL